MYESVCMSCVPELWGLCIFCVGGLCVYWVSCVSAGSWVTGWFTSDALPPFDGCVCVCQGGGDGFCGPLCLEHVSGCMSMVVVCTGSG